MLLRVYNIGYVLCHVFVWNILVVRVYKTVRLFYHVLMSLTTLPIKLRYNLVSLF